jgi:hypothetical protein
MFGENSIYFDDNGSFVYPESNEQVLNNDEEALCETTFVEKDATKAMTEEVNSVTTLDEIKKPEEDYPLDVRITENDKNILDTIIKMNIKLAISQQEKFYNPILTFGSVINDNSSASVKILKKISLRTIVRYIILPMYESL